MDLKRTIKNLGPYPSLLLLAVPTATVEPLKLVALAIAGTGHSITGTAMIVACNLLSLCAVERLFAIVKSKLLTLPWFAKFWNGVTSVRAAIFALFRKLRERMDLRAATHATCCPVCRESSPQPRPSVRRYVGCRADGDVVRLPVASAHEPVLPRAKAAIVLPRVQAAWAYSLAHTAVLRRRTKYQEARGTVPFIEVCFRRLLVALLLPSPSRDVESRDY